MNFVLRFLFLLLNLLYLIVIPFIWLKSKKNKQKVTKVQHPILMISATDLAEKIRQKRITSENICKLYIQRIQEVNPILNAVVQERFENALNDARNVDAYLQSFTGNLDELIQKQPLLGVPLTVKESCSLAGSSFCVGTLSRIGVKSETDGEAVRKLRASGAIPLLVSNTPEICLNWEANNYVTGRTNNPYDVTKTSAGSSGGEGALLGAGASLIGIGSDVAGSIRLPALFNGVFGHKPTPKIISIRGHYPYCTDPNYDKCFVIGPMVRYAKDLRLLTKVMADEKVLCNLRLDEEVDLSKIKVYAMTEEGNSVFSSKVDKEIKSVIRQSAKHLENNCKSEYVKNGAFQLLEESCEIAGSCLYNLKDIPNLLNGENQYLGVELAKSLFGASAYTFNLLIFYLFQNIYQYFVISDSNLKKNEILKKEFVKKLGTNGVLLYPTFPTSAFFHNTFLYNAIGISYLMIVNSLELPATHVPCGFNKNGLPIGFQVIAAPNQDRLCFAVAEELERKFGGWISP